MPSALAPASASSCDEDAAALRQILNSHCPSASTVESLEHTFENMYLGRGTPLRARLLARGWAHPLPHSLSLSPQARVSG